MVLATVAAACVKRTGAAASMERRRREPARAIEVTRAWQRQSFERMHTLCVTPGTPRLEPVHVCPHMFFIVHLYLYLAGEIPVCSTLRMIREPGSTDWDLQTVCAHAYVCGPAVVRVCGLFGARCLCCGVDTRDAVLPRGA